MSGSGKKTRRRAFALLASHLDDREYAQLIRHEYLDIVSPSNPRRVYRVYAQPDKVSVIEDGVEIERLCVQAAETLPDDDVIVMHKVLILGDEQWYLETAQHSPPRSALFGS
ncbi:MAG: hypothetical protein OJF49_003785 [Ktedonobacterales bacterium]|jgi:hypothetical protein|nr:MAG: hypothetical protein OJF49_003785 [Ktedonobacterales bacterium]